MEEETFTARRTWLVSSTRRNDVMTYAMTPSLETDSALLIARFVNRYRLAHDQPQKRPSVCRSSSFVQNGGYFETLGNSLGCF